MREVTVQLRIRYDETSEGKPWKWDWPMLLDREVEAIGFMDDEQVEVDP